MTCFVTINVALAIILIKYCRLYKIYIAYSIGYILKKE